MSSFLIRDRVALLSFFCVEANRLFFSRWLVFAFQSLWAMLAIKSAAFDWLWTTYMSDWYECTYAWAHTHRELARPTASVRILRRSVGWLHGSTALVITVGSVSIFRDPDHELPLLRLTTHGLCIALSFVHVLQNNIVDEFTEMKTKAIWDTVLPVCQSFTSNVSNVQTLLALTSRSELW